MSTPRKPWSELTDAQKLERLSEFTKELLEHLDYCGWGDSWERECSEKLRKQARQYEETGELA